MQEMPYQEIFQIKFFRKLVSTSHVYKVYNFKFLFSLANHTNVA